ncbi:hypothetical protein [Lysobacter enzymogenes]|uniref:hypothetical protein n=1 Tax=Lysobacter enzymogenes TaxID=69 RepID=UPI001AF4A556|nr:hypothetical protein [Lysobacter enzymogenes]QQP99203.1 hypothetical protein JHW41_13805 [Lysobacter enzymogenes]
MKLFTAVALTVASLACAPSAFADPLDACVDLGSSHEVRRASGRLAVIKDDDRYYRVSVINGCSDLSNTTRLSVSTEKQAGRLCPSGSTLTTVRDSCDIAAVEKINEGTYKQYTRRR